MTFVDGIGRRQTLSTLSSNAVVGRGGGGRMSLGVGPHKRASLGARMSIATSNSRRSSLYSRGGQSGQPSTTIDPRPIGEKSFQQENIRALIKFLTAHHYDREISPKILFTPTRKDFVYILTFLFRHLDPAFEFDENWADDFPMFFEALGYPFKISKRSLLSVGSPHTWPALLAALVWLIDVLTFTEVVEQEEEDQCAPSSLVPADQGERVFYGYLSTAYVKFLEGADNFSFLESDLAGQFQAANQAAQTQVDQLQRRVEQVRQECNTLQADRGALQQAQDRVRSYRADVAKFEKLAVELEEYKSVIGRHCTEKQREADGLSNQLNGQAAQKTVLQTAMDSQELSPADVQRMSRERSLLEENMAKLNTELSDVKRRQWDINMTLLSAIDHTDQSMQQYNETGRQIQLIPASAKHADGQNFELKFDAHSSEGSAESMLSVDLKRVVKPALMALKETLSRANRHLAVEKRRATESLSVSGELRAEKQDELQVLQGRVAKCEASYREQRDAKNNELKERVAKIEDTELECNRLHNSQTTALAASEASLQQIEAIVASTLASSTSEQIELRDEVTQTMESLAQHKVYIGQTLSHLDEFVLAARAQIV